MSWSWRLLLILPLLALLNPAAGREQELDRVRFYTQWNDDYLFVAAKCEDVNVVGRRSGLNQPVWLDDDFEVFLHHGKEKPEKINDQSYWISVSAAGGFSFQRGDPGGTWLPASPLVAGAPSPKLEVRVHGSLNDPADADLGWELELGIPWAALGQTKPAPNEVWGFNVVRHLRGDQDARFSYVPQATPIAAQTAPARWGFIVFRGNQGESAWIGPGEQNVVISERAAGSFEVAGRPVPRPLVDGVIQIGEWPDLYRIDAELRPEYLLDVPHEAFAANEAPGEVPAGCSFQTRPVPTRTARGVYLGERLILATYRLDYHDDARDPQRPAFGVRDATGASLLAAQPLRGLGPWFSGLRASWHAEQLAAAAGAHIDLLLVNYDADTVSRGRYANAAVRSLAQAAQELRLQRRAVPGLGLLLPVEAILAELGQGADLTLQVNQEVVYRMIRDYYLLLPPETRGIVGDGRLRAAVVGLTRPPRDLRALPSLLAWCEQRFREDFGLDLLWVGAATWGYRGLPLDAWVSFEAGLEPLASAQGRIATASVGPGLDRSRLPGELAVRRRQGTQTFKDDLKLALQEHCQWLFLSSWNDFRQGDNLAASREYGPLHEQALKIAAMQFDAPQENAWSAKIRRAEIPLKIPAGAVVECPVTIYNSGVRAWHLEDEVKLSYRLYEGDAKPLLRDDGTPLVDRATGRPVTRLLEVDAEGEQSDPLETDGPAEVRTILPLKAVDTAGQPLAPGLYRARLDVVAGTLEGEEKVVDAQGQPVLDAQGQPTTRKVPLPNWLGEMGDPVHDLQFEVVAAESLPAQAGRVLAAGVPARLETGQSYPTIVELRNDGSAAWQAGVGLAVRFDRVSGDVCAAAEPPAPWRRLGGVVELLNAERRARAGEGTEPELVEAVAAGQVTRLRVELPFTTADGQPLPTTLGPRQLQRFSLAVVDAAGVPLPTEQPFSQAVELLPRDYGGAFGWAEVAELMRAGEAQKAQVEVVNTGPRSWPKGSAELAWHWYYWDGTEQRYDAGRTPLAAEVAAGGRTVVTAEVTPPGTAGQYVLLFDLVFDGNVWNGAQPSSTARELARKSVVVVRGPYVPLELAGRFNVVAASGPGMAGDFDGRGQAWPAEHLPPGADDLAAGLYPSGYLGARGSEAPAWQRSVGFWFPRQGGQASAIRAEGQTIAIDRGTYRRLHLLAASVGEPLSCTLTVLPERSANRRPVELAPVTVPSWTSPPEGGALAGFRAPYRLAGGEPLAGPAWLHHVVVPVVADGPISAIVLPNQPALRVVAMTAELAPPTAGPAR